MTGHPRIGCFIYIDSTFWSMLAHGVTTHAAEFGATVEVLSACDADAQDAMLAQLWIDLSSIRAFSTIREGLAFAQRVVRA